MLGLFLPILPELATDSLSQKATLDFVIFPAVQRRSSLRKGTSHSVINGLAPRTTGLPASWVASWGNPRVGSAAPSFFVKLTVHVPLDAPGRKLQGLVDLLQDSLQLLLLSNLRLGHFRNVQLLTLKFLWGDKGEREQPLSPATDNPNSRAYAHSFPHTYSCAHTFHSFHQLY